MDNVINNGYFIEIPLGGDLDEDGEWTDDKGDPWTPSPTEIKVINNPDTVDILQVEFRDADLGTYRLFASAEDLEGAPERSRFQLQLTFASGAKVATYPYELYIVR